MNVTEHDGRGNIVRTYTVPGTAEDVASAVDTTIGTRLEQRLVDLQAIIDRPQTALADNTVAAVRAAIRDLQSEVKTLARVDRLQTRKLLRLLNGTD